MAQPKAQLNGEDFEKNVESIMRCDGFKSHFARTLSDRFISRSPMSKYDTLVKQRPVVGSNEAPERIESPQLSKSVKSEPMVDTEKTGAALKISEMSRIEVTALNMEVDTLRWQLAQTESNRQMHIAFLKQVVTFLNKVKEHIEYQKEEPPRIGNTLSRGQRSFNYADLPRSRSVVHVNKNPDYALTPEKKINTRKISKSISNVNGYKECGALRSPSKLSLTPEIEKAQKITEEITRLITLAKTVLSTKLPDLACTCINKNNDLNLIKENGKVKIDNALIEKVKLNLIEEDTNNDFTIDTVCDSENSNNSITNTFAHEKDLNELVVTPSVNCGLDNDFAETKVSQKEQGKNETDSIKSVATKVVMDKMNEYNHESNFVEDESGFSSMCSFQEIGIPIISIIPPSPCKDIVYMEEIPDIDTDTWKSNGIAIEKQAVKVFWV